VCGVGAPASFGPPATGSAAGNTTAVEIDAPSGFRDLDPRFLCSDLVPASELGLRLSKLQNGVPYTVAVAAVDISGNASPIRKAFVQSPVAGVDPMPDTDAGTADAGTADAGTTKLGRSGCDCQLGQSNRNALPWPAILLLPLTRHLRRRPDRQRD
jgi:hypothetical protein